MMNCNICGNLMVDAFTTFTVRRDGSVYVVENVPCLECPVCEHISFIQDVAVKLEKYCSGRVLPEKTIAAWGYRWGNLIIEIPKEGNVTSTKNIPLSPTMLGTQHDKKTPRYEGITTSAPI